MKKARRDHTAVALARARRIAGAAGQEFIEVFLDTPLAVCDARDTKGLYRRARSGEIQEFTGISSPDVPPLHPEVTIQGQREELCAPVQRIVALLRSHLLIPPGV